MSCSGSDVKLKNTEGVHAIVKHTKLRFEHTVFLCAIFYCTQLRYCGRPLIMQHEI